MLARSLDAAFDNIACAPMCEALINFGWLGIPLIAFAFGIVLRAVDLTYIRTATVNRGKVTIVLVVYPLLLGQTFLITRGDFLSPWAFTVGMLLAAMPLLGFQMLRLTRLLPAAVRRHKYF
jgi:hypothetical protein